MKLYFPHKLTLCSACTYPLQHTVSAQSITKSICFLSYPLLSHCVLHTVNINVTDNGLGAVIALCSIHSFHQTKTSGFTAITKVENGLKPIPLLVTDLIAVRYSESIVKVPEDGAQITRRN